MADLIVTAKNAEKTGNLFDAAQMYERAFSSDGEEWLCVKLGELYGELGDAEKEKNWYEKVRYTDNELLADRLISYYISHKEFHKASEQYGISFPAASYKSKLNFADKLYACGAYNQAIFWYEECLRGGTQTMNNPYLSVVGEYDPSNGSNRQKYGKILAKADCSFAVSDYSGAFFQYYKAAKKGDLYSMRKAAECCYVLEEYKQAAKICRDILSADEHNGDVMFLLGECYYHGENENTFENAVYWYEYSLECGCVKAYYPLGICRQFGRGCDKDAEAAHDCFEKGAQFDYDRYNCICKLGNLLLDDGNIDGALEKFSIGAEHGNQLALVNIALLFFDGAARDKFVYKQIVCMLLKAEILGNKRAREILENARSANS